VAVWSGGAWTRAAAEPGLEAAAARPRSWIIEDGVGSPVQLCAAVRAESGEPRAAAWEETV
jgi:hypothetical protein